ncbi:uncharacterized protein [Dendrobates tinctorius]|uniref:uncharacterized protein isoform X2 n=1 Tax=Dendrobates tinctorius TaxID=92724 RepID=UPI003CC9A8BC
MAEWNNSSQNAPDTHELEKLRTLRSPLTLNCRDEEEQKIHNGDLRSQTPPGPLRNPEEEIAIIKNLMDTNIEELGHLIVKVLQLSNWPVQDAPCPAKRNRSFMDLQDDFRSKMDQLEKVVGALSSTRPSNPFSEYDIYFLMSQIKDDDWIHLMRPLGIEEHMKTCCTLYSNRLEQKYQMLQIWLNRPQDGMKTHREQLVDVLMVIGYECLASMFKNGSIRSAPQLR